MFRHFAVITVVITATLALFADGEGREMLHDQAEKQEQRAAMQKAGKQDPKLAKGVSFRDHSKAQGSFGSDPGPPPAPPKNYGPARAKNYGQQHGTIGPQTVVAASDRAIGQAYDLPDVLPPGMTEEEARKMRLQLQARTDKKLATDQQLETILEKSRVRTGATTSDDW
jgi:hypothetical protein